MIQLREKDLPARDLLAMAKELRVLTARRALLFINDRVDVALAVNADGIQLGENSLPVKEVRHLSNGRLIIGRSVHNVSGAAEAQARGANFLISGTIFPSKSHTNYEAAGLKLLQDLISWRRQWSNPPGAGLVRIFPTNGRYISRLPVITRYR